MLPKLKKGSVLSFVTIMVILFSALAFGAYFALNKLNLLPSDSAANTSGNRFQKEVVMRSFDFKNSDGQKKKFIVLKKSEEGGIPIADSYITDSKLSLPTAVKIDHLSGDSNLGYAASGVNALGSSLVISASPGNGKKVLMVAISVGDASTITLLDENGKIVSESVVDNILLSVKNNCKCSFTFDSWDGNDKFRVKVPTAKEGTFRVTINAKNGELLNGIEKI